MRCTSPVAVFHGLVDARVEVLRETERPKLFPRFAGRETLDAGDLLSEVPALRVR
jgi:hypothetical protein